jgi:hypothetical protein
MNLHQIASGAISAVNPMRTVTILQSTGYTTGADGTQTPAYSTTTAQAQIQELSTGDIKRLEGMNAQNVQQKVYLTGNYEGLFRVLGKGGDLIKFGSQTYLVTAVLERWPDWCSVGITMQLDGA